MKDEISERDLFDLFQQNLPSVALRANDVDKLHRRVMVEVASLRHSSATQISSGPQRYYALNGNNPSVRNPYTAATPEPIQENIFSKLAGRVTRQRTALSFSLMATAVAALLFFIIQLPRVFDVPRQSVEPADTVAPPKTLPILEPSADEQPTIRVAADSAEVTVTLADGTKKRIDVGSEQTAQQGDIIETTSGGATLIFSAGRRTEIETASRVIVETLDSQNQGLQVALTVSSGTTRHLIETPLSANDRFEVRSALATATVLGTEFVFETRPDGSTYIETLTGVVFVRNADGAQVQLQADRYTLVERGTALQVLSHEQDRATPTTAPKPTPTSTATNAPILTPSPSPTEMIPAPAATPTAAPTAPDIDIPVTTNRAANPPESRNEGSLSEPNPDSADSPTSGEEDGAPSAATATVASQQPTTIPTYTSVPASATAALVPSVTPTPTSTRPQLAATATHTATPQPTATATHTAAATNTATYTSVPTTQADLVPTSTAVATATAIDATATVTEIPTATETPTSIPTSTPTPTATQTSTLIPTPTQTQTPTVLPTMTPTVQNNPPIAEADHFVVDEDQPLTLPVLANDSDPDGDALDLVAGGQALFGQVTIGDSGALTYVPNPDFSGTDTFDYQVSDGRDSVTGTVTLIVRAVNDPPTFELLITQISIQEDSGTQSVPNLLGARSAGADDEIGQQLRFEVTSDNGPLFSGQPTIDISSGTLTFTPAPDVAGIATLSVRLFDDGGTENGGNDSSPAATIRIEVVAGNDIPHAVDDLISTDEDSIVVGNVLAANPNQPDNDIDGDLLNIVMVQNEPERVGTAFSLASGAKLRLTADGTFSFDPGDAYQHLQSGASSEEIISYTIDDSAGGRATATVHILVTVAMIRRRHMMILCRQQPAAPNLM